MSQLKNTTTVFQNNDLVTAAKLNSLVNDTTLDTNAIVDQPPPTGLAGTDLVLGYEASSNSLVAIDIDTLRSTGSELVQLKANSITTLTDSDLNISQDNELRSLTLTAGSEAAGINLVNAGTSGIQLINQGTRATDNKIQLNDSPVFVDENLEILGVGIDGNMTSVVGSPILNISFANNHGLGNNFPIELKMDTNSPEFDVLALSNEAGWTGATYSVTGLNSINVTLPANATVAYTNQPITVRRVALTNSQLSYLSRLHVRGVARFDGATNFDVAPTFKGVAIKPRFDYLIQTRSQQTYNYTWAGAQNPTVPYGVKIDPLDITFTPSKAGNKVILDWEIFGEGSQDSNMVFVVTRTPNSGAGIGVPVALPDSVDANNNTWSGVTCGPYDVDNLTTPTSRRVRIVDMNTLDVSCTYSVYVRNSANASRAFYLNRSTGAEAVEKETGLSTGHAHEIYV